MKHRAIFLDRDGTMNQDDGYTYRVGDYHLYPWTIEAVQLLNRSGWKVVVVSNQSGVARGLFSEEDVREVHQYLVRQIKAGGAWLDAIYYCPHHPEGIIPEYSILCRCRKPFTGMLEKAVADLGIDLAGSWVIGDKYDIDIQLARNAGIHSALVLTGYGREAFEARHRGWDFQPDLIADHLLQAVEAILRSVV